MNSELAIHACGNQGHHGCLSLSLSMMVTFVNLTEPRITWKESLYEILFRSDHLVGMSVGWGVSEVN